MPVAETHCHARVAPCIILRGAMDTIDTMDLLDTLG